MRAVFKLRLTHPTQTDQHPRLPNCSKAAWNRDTSFFYSWFTLHKENWLKIPKTDHSRDGQSYNTSLLPQKGWRDQVQAAVISVRVHPLENFANYAKCFKLSQKKANWAACYEAYDKTLNNLPPFIKFCIWREELPSHSTAIMSLSWSAAT